LEHTYSAMHGSPNRPLIDDKEEICNGASSQSGTLMHDNTDIKQHWIV
jgi:hypothetical protein